MEENQNPVANRTAVLREEFDDWAVLFDPQTGNAFGLNPVSVFIWKQLDGKTPITEITQRLQKNCQDAPQDTRKYLQAFIEQLIQKGLAGYEV